MQTNECNKAFDISRKIVKDNRQAMIYMSVRKITNDAGQKLKRMMMMMTMMT